MSLSDKTISELIGDGNFVPAEFLEGRENLNPDIIKEVVRFRNWHGFSSLLTSMWRREGSHSIGAADMVLYKKWKQSQPGYQHLWRIATTYPWWGIGIYDDWQVEGESVIGLHVDICTPTQRDRPLRWIRSNGIYYYQSVKSGIFYDKDGNSTTLNQVFE